ncbi:MAG TPA: aminotransferase class V-fold PLP-dependent enzyme, partial [Candidatus Limnocylindria bacterium]|nr:aminotransferase class V-fold PLP-dependent enzyme [Candidatus Limnocylindria bacterium]
PTGFGVLYGRKQLLEAMPPWQGGGDMILSVTFEKTTYNQLPWKFEAGTSSYVDAIGLGAAVDYLEGVGVAKIHEHELSLVAYLLPRLREMGGVTVYGPKTLEERVGVVSFNIEGIHPHDVATIFDREGVCVRAGHHCNQLLMTRLGVAATTRASFYLYNTTAECDALLGAIDKAKKVFKV